MSRARVRVRGVKRLDRLGAGRKRVWDPDVGRYPGGSPTAADRPGNPGARRPDRSRGVRVQGVGCTWYLQRVLRQQLRDGRIEPVFDFVFLDGAHTWDADGLAFLLVDRLLKPGGWILLDDLAWKLDAARFPDVPPAQRELAHIREVWDLLVLPDSSYDEMSTDGLWGWARKSPTPTPAVRTVVRRDLIGSVRELGRPRDPSSAQAG